MWLFTAPFFGTLPAFIVFSIMHASTYARTYIFGVHSSIGKKLGDFMVNSNDKFMLFASGAEFFVLVRFVVRTLTFRIPAMIKLVLYFVFFKLRYNNSLFTQHIVKSWEVRVDRWLSHPSVPPALRQIWLSAKEAIRTKLGPLFLQEQQQQNHHETRKTQ